MLCTVSVVHLSFPWSFRLGLPVHVSVVPVALPLIAHVSLPCPSSVFRVDDPLVPNVLFISVGRLATVYTGTKAPESTLVMSVGPRDFRITATRKIFDYRVCDSPRWVHWV